ncbi:Si-specific NAD(P)(+) transhydrogenase [Sansalvadorimonas sp. 2012CJ34-2]|uniref:Soluble pyridine nucleotide transhydrogenase n=1 Tax=Parendozoicomonas callyspongiae TaxID=2942213 RepID=A0ABT0PEM5_9GAMM|nr:Si-specific NAD(P)(+) transhydrogenase [Sansalvadorimonas sp. 2012CJ34-2]MCL6269825.1 Si-specific NAD(P)(+) transhydrogenase [Sansalvadorimonas sp. 2012CJ34-2]
MAVTNYDLIILGSGPAGEGAAMSAVKLGKRVAVVEEKSVVGGNCTHLGTIPSKALRHSVKEIHTFNNNPMFREIGEPRWFSFPNVLKRAYDVIGQQVASRAHYYSRNRIALYVGRGSFVDENTIEVVEKNGNVERIAARNIMIATGSRPYRPADVDFLHPRIYDSDTILRLNHTPRRIIIYGAGVIGSEYASIFSSLGVLVDLVDTRDRLLSFLDKEISDALSFHMRNQNVIIRHNEEYQKIEGHDDGVTMHLKSGKVLKGSALLWANGRTGNTSGLGLENLGLAANSRGQLEVNEFYQTAVDNIYAAGDVIGWPSLASASYDQGRFAAANISGEKTARSLSSVPAGIYTIPEISSLGKTEEELTAAAIPYEVGKAFFSRLARAQITGETAGMLKILFHRETLEILGIHCFGDQSSEIIHIGQSVMEREGERNSLHYFLNTTFNYPTMAEAYRVAALDGFNRLA